MGTKGILRTWGATVCLSISNLLIFYLRSQELWLEGTNGILDFSFDQDTTSSNRSKIDFFFDKDNNDDKDNETPLEVLGQQTQGNNCWLLLDSLVYLGCGVDGQVFSATLDCHNGGGGRGAASNRAYSANRSSSRTSSSRRDLVLKVATTSPTSSWYRYVSLGDSDVRKKIEIHRALFSSGKTALQPDDARRHFHAPIGTVRVPVDKLYEEVANSKRATPRCRGILQPHRPPRLDSNGATTAKGSSATTHAIGYVMEAAKGEKIGPIFLSSLHPDHRRHIARDLVWIYRYMYERRFIHHDISLFHIYYGENVTSLIDFERFAILKESNREHNEIFQSFQQYQLLTLLANVCAKDRFDVPNRISRKIDRFLTNTTTIYRLVSAIEECDFTKNQRMSLSPSDTILNLLESFQGRMTAETYQILFDLTAL